MMKNIFIKRTVAFVMAFVLVMVGMVTTNPVAAKAATPVTRIFVSSYNDEIVLREGQKLTAEVIESLDITLQGQTASGDEILLPVKVKEKGQYIHSTNGKVTLTLYSGDVTTTLKVKVKTKAAKLMLKATGVTLREGQVLTKSDVAKVVKATVTYKGGKKVSNFKGYLCNQIGQVVKPNAKGKYKLTLHLEKAKKSVYVKVNKIKRLYIGKCSMNSLVEGESFSADQFKELTNVTAVYKNNSKKKLTSYTVNAAKIVTANPDGKFIVTVKYGKNSDKIAIPVKKQYTVNTSVTGSGTVTIDSLNTSSKKVIIGTTVVLTANPTANYKFDGWIVNGKIVSTNIAYSFKVNSNINVTAKFTKVEKPIVTYKVTVNGGTINGKTAETIETGKTVKIVANEPEAGWKFVNWTDETGKVLGTEPELKVTVTEDISVTANFQKIQYKLTVKSKGTVKLNGRLLDFADGRATRETEFGESFILEAISNKHFIFVNWTDNKGNVLSTNPELDVTVDGYKTVIANFEEVYTITANAENGFATINGEASSETVPVGTEVTLNATPAEYYSFVNWTNEDGDVLGTEPELKVTVTEDISVTANFSKNVYDLTVKSNSVVKLNGREIQFVDGANSRNVVAGDSVILEAIRSYHFQFVNWTDEEGNVLGTEPELDVTVDENKTVIANFKEVYALTVNSENGEVAIDGLVMPNRILEKGLHELVATPAENYEFISWTDSEGNVLGTEPTLKVELVDKNITVTANFARVQYLLTVNSNSLVKCNGKDIVFIDGTNTISVEAGSVVTLEAMFNEHFALSNWSDAEGNIIGTGYILEVTVDENKTVNANFKEIYALTVKTENGRVTIDGIDSSFLQSTMFDKGVHQLVAIPDENYEFLCWMAEDGTVISANPILDIELVDQDIAIRAAFIREQYLLTVKSDSTVKYNSSDLILTNGETSILVNSNEVANLEATDSDHFRFVNWTDEEGNVIGTEPELDVFVDEHKTVIANFREVYVLTVNAENGEVMIDGRWLSNQVLEKGIHELVATPAEKYEFISWTDEEGNVLGTEPTLEVELIDKDIIVTANFAKIEYALTVKSSSSTVKLNGATMSFVDGVASEIFETGTVVSLTATDSANRRFVRWTNSDTGEVLSTSKTFAMTVDSNITIVAVFEDVFKVTVNMVGGKGKVTFNQESLDFYDNVAETTIIPGNYVLKAFSSDDYDFVNWTDETGRLLSTSAEYQIAVTKNTVINANFMEAEKTVMVTYKHSNGQVILSEAVLFGESLTPPTSNLVRLDKDFVGWTLGEVLYEGAYDADEFYSTDGVALSTAIAELTEARQAVELTSTYVEKPPVTYTITVTGGTITQPSELAGLTFATVEADTHVFVHADEPAEGMVFNYWTDATGQKVGNNAEYGVFVNSNVELIAVYSEEEVEPEPIVYFNDNGEVSLENAAIKFNLSSRIPASYEKLEWGLIVSPMNSSEEELVYNSGISGVLVIADDTPETATTKNADLRYTFTTAPAVFERFDCMYARVYAIVKDATGTKTIYSNIITVAW